MKHSLTSKKKAFVYKRDIACVASYISSLDITSESDWEYANQVHEMLSAYILKLTDIIRRVNSHPESNKSVDVAYHQAKLQLLDKLCSILKSNMGEYCLLTECYRIL